MIATSAQVQPVAENICARICFVSFFNKTHNSNQGEYDQALDYYRKALAILKQEFGEDHPNVALCYNNMGEVYRVQ